MPLQRVCGCWAFFPQRKRASSSPQMGWGPAAEAEQAQGAGSRDKFTAGGVSEQCGEALGAPWWGDEHR